MTIPKAFSGQQTPAGAKRMRDNAETDRLAALALEAELVATFGRVPSRLQQAALELLSVTLVRSRRLRAAGRQDHDERVLAERLLQRLGLTDTAPAETAKDVVPA